jgi:hypothetical protein
MSRPGLNIVVANVDRVPSDGVCYGVHIFLNSEEFVIDLFIIPLEGYDMVLGGALAVHLGTPSMGFQQSTP